MKIVANSLPKSGTHLLTRILDLSGFKENDIHFSSSLLRRTARNIFKNLVKRHKTDKFDEGVWIDLDKNRSMKRKYFELLIDSFPDKTYSQGHLPYSDKIADIFENNNIKIMYIIRDPRDVVVSHFHQHLKEPNYQGHKLMNLASSDKERIIHSINGFYQDNEKAQSSIKTRLKNSIDWYFSTSSNVLPLKFEDVIGAKGGGALGVQKDTLTKIEGFLNLEEDYLQSRKQDIFYTKASTFRKGKIGDWQNYVDEEIKDILKRDIGEYLIRLGYEENYDW